MDAEHLAHLNPQLGVLSVPEVWTRVCELVVISEAEGILQKSRHFLKLDFLAIVSAFFVPTLASRRVTLNAYFHFVLKVKAEKRKRPHLFITWCVCITKRLLLKTFDFLRFAATATLAQFGGLLKS